MCAEPVQGIAYIVESLQSSETEKQDQDGELNPFPSIMTDLDLAHSKRAQAKGSLISGMRDACRKGLLDWSPRLLLAMYSCDIQAASESTLTLICVLR